MAEEKTTYYERHREKILAYEKARRAADPEGMREYQRRYYQLNKDKILSNRQKRERSAVVRKPRAARVPKEPKAPAEPKVNLRKLPRQYFQYEKEEPPAPFGFPQKPHQVKKMLELCPQGFYQPPPSANPFVLTF